MSSQWKAFLESRGARVDENGAAHFTADEASPACALCELSHLGLIRLQGEDAAQFLQGQTTNDIRAVDESHSQLNSCCTPKGRMLASFRVFRRGEDIFLQLPHETLAPLLRRLSMYLLRSKVSLSNASDELVSIGLAGEHAATLLQELSPTLPGETDQVVQAEGLTIIRVAGQPQRYELIGPEAQMEQVWDALARQATVMDADYWSLLDIRAGIPSVYAQTVEAFIPQMVNLQLVNGVSFSKGCYCGQEIVTRTQHRGTLKRRMYLAHVDSPQRPAPGAELHSPSAEHEQGAGLVVAASPAPEGGYDLLAMLQTPCVHADDVRLGDAQGPKLVFRDLPYSME